MDPLMTADDGSSGEGAASQAGEEPPPKWYLVRKNQVRVAIILLMIAAIIIAVAVFNVQDKFGDALEWFEDHQVEGGFVFVLVYWIATVFLLPASILSLGAGAVFGIGLGIVIVMVGATLGQTSAFLVGRYVLREWVETLVHKYPTMEAVDGAITHEGWKIVGLLRLSPAIPYNVLNYALSLTGVKLAPYFLASFFGIIPGVVLFVWVGSAARDLAEITSGEKTLDGPATIAIFAVSGVLIIVTIVFVTILAKRAVKKKLAEAEERKAAGAEGGAEVVVEA